MSVATGTGTWVGQSVPRVEDEALLRGEGRFMDDLAPVPHAFHAAIVRSQLAHAQVTAPKIEVMATTKPARKPFGPFNPRSTTCWIRMGSRTRATATATARAIV